MRLLIGLLIGFSIAGCGGDSKKSTTEVSVLSEKQIDNYSDATITKDQIVDSFQSSDVFLGISLALRALTSVSPSEAFTSANRDDQPLIFPGAISSKFIILYNYCQRPESERSMIHDFECQLDQFRDNDADLTPENSHIVISRKLKPYKTSSNKPPRHPRVESQNYEISISDLDDSDALSGYRRSTKGLFEVRRDKGLNWFAPYYFPQSDYGDFSFHLDEDLTVDASGDTKNSPQYKVAFDTRRTIRPRSSQPIRFVNTSFNFMILPQPIVSKKVSMYNYKDTGGTYKNMLAQGEIKDLSGTIEFSIGKNRYQFNVGSNNLKYLTPSEENHYNDIGCETHFYSDGVLKLTDAANNLIEFVYSRGVSEVKRNNLTGLEKTTYSCRAEVKFNGETIYQAF